MSERTKYCLMCLPGIAALVLLYFTLVWGGHVLLARQDLLDKRCEMRGGVYTHDLCLDPKALR